MTFCDRHYNFSGSSKKIAKARAAIEALQAYYASGSGDCHFGHSPEIEADGTLSWQCYAKGGMEELDEVLIPLTVSGKLSITVYEGSTDGCCEGALWIFENGSCLHVAHWGADIGLHAALAAVKLTQGSDIDAALTLIDRIKVARSDGWDEDDWAHLRAAGVCSQLLADAANAQPVLLQSTLLAQALQEVGADMAFVRKYLRRYKAMKKSAIHAIDGLLAVIESIELDSVTTNFGAFKNGKTVRSISLRI